MKALRDAFRKDSTGTSGFARAREVAGEAVQEEFQIIDRGVEDSLKSSSLADRVLGAWAWAVRPAMKAVMAYGSGVAGYAEGLERHSRNLAYEDRTDIPTPVAPERIPPAL